MTQRPAILSLSQQAVVFLALTLILGCAINVEARVTRIVIEQRQSPAYEGKSFGGAGQYEILVGKAYGELDPKDPHNTIITDLQFAPRNARGLVEYVATFTLIKPVDLARANGVLLYAVPNRGNRISTTAFGVAGETGEEFFLKRGYVILHSGWQGDLPTRLGAETITVPIAKNPDGSSIVGPALARFSNMPAGANTLSLPVAHETASLDTAKATLTKQASEEGAVIPISGADWAFADCGKTPFPGAPDANKVCVKGGFDPAYLYELRYAAKDPLVLGIGLAATRDVVSFFRRAAKDDSDTANPEFKYGDLSGLMTLQPPVIKRVLPMLVPKVDADGNETSGVPSPLHQAPLGSYLGWNVTRAGFYKGRVCGFAGGFIPFAKTKAERLATGDPRLSLEERYHDHAGYVDAVKTAVGRLLSRRFLLPEDAERLIRQADESGVLR